MILYPRLNSRVGMHLKTDRQRNEARIGLTLEKKKDSGFRKEERREEEEKNKDGLTREGIMHTD